MQILPMADSQTTAEKEPHTLGTIVELADPEEVSQEEVCCGGPPAPKSSPFEKPGYQLQHYVRAFLKNQESDIALVKTKLEPADHWGTLFARLGLNRNNYKVAPGLYGIGTPGKDSEVLVTANYKLTFDAVRKELAGLNCWLLVLDTCGINVWCAAGKKTFSTKELVEKLDTTRLAEKVSHRRIIVPQLGAIGIAAHRVRLQSGFKVVYGPIQAGDIRYFLHNGLTVTENMRMVTFHLHERFILIPVELNNFIKKTWWIFPLMFLLSGIGTSFFSIEAAWQRGLVSSAATVLGGFLGAVIVPLLLPWIPCRKFSFKGALVGGVVGLVWLQTLTILTTMETVATLLLVTAISSYLAMNYTGSTPFTSPSGVEKEMKLAIPLQIVSVITAAVLWLVSPFI